jgi:hypothetical protein
LWTLQQGALFVPGQVANNPADAIHPPEMPAGICGRDTAEAAQPFPTRETKLINQRVSHSLSGRLEGGRHCLTIHKVVGDVLQ